MFVVVWMFEVRAGAEQEFVRAYGPDGDWVQLFRRSPGYLETELMRDVAVSTKFVTIDRWASRQAFEDFKTLAKEEYDALDARGQRFTRSERLIGHFET